MLEGFSSEKCDERFCSLTIEYEERETWAAECCWMVWYFPFTRRIRYETSADTFFENVTNTEMTLVISGVFKNNVLVNSHFPTQENAIFLCLNDRKSVTQSPH